MQAVLRRRGGRPRSLRLAFCRAFLLCLCVCCVVPVSAYAVALTAQQVRAAQSEQSRVVADVGNASRPFAVFGYLPEYRQGGFPYEDVFAHGLTHLIFFSIEVDPQTLQLSHTEDRLPQGEEWWRIRRLADEYGVKLMVSVGGGGRSEGFAPLVQDRVKRGVFIDQLNTFLLERGLDGVDINWEYPQREVEWRNFGWFMRELKTVLGYAMLRDDANDAEAEQKAESSNTAEAGSTEGPRPSLSEATSSEGAYNVLLQRWRDQHQREGTTAAGVLTQPTAARRLHTSDRRGALRRTQVRPAVLTMAVHPHPQIALALQSFRVLPALDYIHWMAYDHIAPRQPHSSVTYAKEVLGESYIGALDDFYYTTGRSRPSDRWNKAAAARGGGGQGAAEDTDHSDVVAEEEGEDATAEVEVPKQPRGAVGATAERTGETERVPLASLHDHRRKLTLGIPFYGRHRDDPRREPETYERLVFFIRQWVAKEHPTWKENGKELRRKNEYGGYSFNSYADVQAKMRVARKAGPRGGIAGIMIWELGQDLRPPSSEPLSLLRAVSAQLKVWNASCPQRATASVETAPSTVPPADAHTSTRPPAPPVAASVDEEKKATTVEEGKDSAEKHTATEAAEAADGAAPFHVAGDDVGDL